MPIRRRIKGRAVSAPLPQIPARLKTPKPKNTMPPIKSIMVGNVMLKKGDDVYYPDENFEENEEMSLGTITGIFFDIADSIYKVKIKSVKGLIPISDIEVQASAEEDEDDLPLKGVGRADIDGVDVHEPTAADHWRQYSKDTLRALLVESNSLLFRICEYSIEEVKPALDEWFVKHNEREREFDQERLEKEAVIRDEELALLARLKAKYDAS